MKDRFKAKNQRSWLLRFHSQTAGVSLTAQQPLNNIARAALQALAAVLTRGRGVNNNPIRRGTGFESRPSMPGLRPGLLPAPHP